MRFLSPSVLSLHLLPHRGGVSQDVFEHHDEETPSDLPFTALEDLHYALETMQTRYFELWLGTWPESIDWTGAVMGTYISAALNSLTRSLGYSLPATSPQSFEDLHIKAVAEKWRIENEINRYFTHGIGYYFGENAFAIRMQAFDDMLWVVLGWLEAIKFVQVHAQTHYDWENLGQETEERGSDRWYGEQFLPAFAHRARIFYDLAKHGWDTQLCGGGMLWNPHMLPYKNAITNELYIAASAGMYLYFPGDNISSPFSEPQKPPPGAFDQVAVNLTLEEEEELLVKILPYDRTFLRAAVEAYDWLKRSNMTNDQGLYVDGFHIKNYGVNDTIGTGECDERSEEVYTYNQGVLLSGLRALWEATGNISYLTDGHQLVRNVIAATGWRLYHEPHLPPGWEGRWKWYGLGRAGVLEDSCDASGSCTQDSQTFKGIFFHHLTLFCEPLPDRAKMPGKTYGGSKETRMLHRQSCAEYAPWVVRNARAAMRTRDERGRFGMWWAADVGADEGWNWRDVEPLSERVPKGVVGESEDTRHSMTHGTGTTWDGFPHRRADPSLPAENESSDPNDRGRGRTVETQGGGVAVLRAMWELVIMYQKDS
ncbi:Six-hairpin glycosidase [Rhizodiscina lignyota]|uniref:Six-hairpin glycosidase n=1 Tax=Rhizodiscina lignyota TaxID=1504668 RepID=A0A9P4I2A6_9PEZI|nr:Six-hairpin glycosidase [Rhizodiscina lignyota]